MSTNAKALLEVCSLSCSPNKDKSLFHDVNLAIRKGDVVVLQGKSGCGKTTLLKCLAHLNVCDGEILYRGEAPKQYGVPNYRTRVLYVPQRPSILSGSPRDFLEQLSKFGAYKSPGRKEHHDLVTAKSENFAKRAVDISVEWGVEETLWDRPWATLSGGEAQRIALAAAVGLNCAEIMLLDEPTSALDADSCSRVEKHLCSMLQVKDVATKALVWITHSEEQAQRVGTRFIQVESGTCREVLVADESV